MFSVKYEKLTCVMRFFLPKNTKCTSHFSDLKPQCMLFCKLTSLEMGMIPHGHDFSRHFNLLFTIFFNLHMWFQSFSTELNPCLPHSAKYDEMKSCTLLQEYFFLKKKASAQSFYPKQRSSRVVKTTNEVRSFSFFKIIYSSTLAFVTFLLSHSFPMHPSFLYPLKTSKNLTVFWCFQGLEKGCIGNKWDNRNSLEKWKNTEVSFWKRKIKT